MIKIAKVRFNSNGKVYHYFCPKHLEDKIQKGTYVIVPDKYSEMRYKTAQCIGIQSYKESEVPEYIYEYIVDVVDSDSYERTKRQQQRGKDLESIFQALKRYADKNCGCLSVAMKINSDVPDEYRWEIIIDDPIGDGFICPNDSIALKVVSAMGNPRYF